MSNEGLGDKMKGNVKEGVGKGQEKWGEATGDVDQQAQGEEKQAEGKMDKAKGGMKDAWGNVKNAADDVTD